MTIHVATWILWALGITVGTVSLGLIGFAVYTLYCFGFFGSGRRYR